MVDTIMTKRGSMSAHQTLAMPSVNVIVKPLGKMTMVTLRDRTHRGSGLSRDRRRATARRAGTFGVMTFGGGAIDAATSGSHGVGHAVEVAGEAMAMAGELGLMSVVLAFGVRSFFSLADSSSNQTKILTSSQFSAFWTWYAAQDKPSFEACAYALDQVGVDDDVEEQEQPIDDESPVVDHWYLNDEGVKTIAPSVSKRTHATQDIDAFEGDQQVRARMAEVEKLDLTSTQKSKISSIRRSRDDLIEALRGVPRSDASNEMVADIVALWNTTLDEMVNDVTTRGLDKLRSVRQYVIDIDKTHDDLDLSGSGINLAKD